MFACVTKVVKGTDPEWDTNAAREATRKQAQNHASKRTWECETCEWESAVAKFPFAHRSTGNPVSGRQCFPGPTEALLPGGTSEAPGAAQHRELLTHVCEHFVQLGRLPGDVAALREREFQQTRGDGALGSDGEQPRPAGDPRRTRRRSRGRLP